MSLKVKQLLSILDRLAQLQAVGGAQQEAWRARLVELSQAAEQPVCVANAGLLKAGKSTLLNAVFGKEELFKTGAARTTVAASTRALGRLELVDTPGIDAYEHDSAEAERVLRRADMVLVVHSVTDGEFDQQELDFLAQLGRYFPDKDARQRALIPVFSKGEGVKAGELDAVCEKACAQWLQVLGVAPRRVFRVFSVRHLKGIKEQKPVFCERSGIPELVSFLHENADSLAQVRAQLSAARLDELVGQIGEAIDLQVREKKEQHARLVQANQPKVELLKTGDKSLRSSIRAMYRNI